MGTASLARPALALYHATAPMPGQGPRLPHTSPVSTLCTHPALTQRRPHQLLQSALKLCRRTMSFRGSVFFAKAQVDMISSCAGCANGVVGESNAVSGRRASGARTGPDQTLILSRKDCGVVASRCIPRPLPRGEGSAFGGSSGRDAAPAPCPLTYPVP